MMSNSLKSVNKRNTATPQSEKAVKGQKKNNAGGYAFKVSPFDVAKRFVILGSESSFYQTGPVKAQFNADNLIGVIKTSEEQHRALVDYIVEVSNEGRAPKQDPGLFALAIASSYGSDEGKRYALSKLNEVARTSTTLFKFIGYALQFRPWGRALKRAVADWYLSKSADKAAFQIVKYRNREGWTHNDVLQLVHPKGDAEWHGLADYVVYGKQDKVPAIVKGFEAAKTASSESNLIDVINEYNLTWEMIPSEKLTPKVWEVLFKNGMPLGALIRQLPTLTRLEILKGTNANVKAAVAQLTDEEQIKRARLHPIQILLAMKTYESGRSLMGNSRWTPVRHIIDALDKAFYMAFKNVEPTNKNFLVALDVSGSMAWGQVGGVPITPCEASAAVALSIAKTEPWVHTIGFTGGSSRSAYSWSNAKKATPAGSGKYASTVSELDISSNMRLTDAVAKVSHLPMGGTDCALPMLYAMERNLDVDVFVVITDNETWAGRIHPFEAMKQYRAKMNKPEAKLIVLATEATKFTIADPFDPGMLDIAGLDSSVPALMNSFIKGI